MKNLQKISLRNTHAFTEFFLKYIEQDPSLRPFYSRFPQPENFEGQLKEKAAQFSADSRKVLVDALQDQYKRLDVVPDAVGKNIQGLLDKKTFTVTTGHQLNIF